MTDGFANAVTVSIPILALAAGAEARTIRERLKRPDQKWEREFAKYNKGVPRLSRLHTVERVLALAGAVVWLSVFVLLTLAELYSLVWLADGEPPGHAGLATFTLISIGLAMLSLIMAPTLYLAVPLLLPLDLVPAGLSKAVLPKAASQRGRSFIRLMFSELEGAIDRAAAKVEADEGARKSASSPDEGSGRATP
jgi:hypothetical protein